MIYITIGVVIVLTLCVWLLFPLETIEKVGFTTAISTVALAFVTSIYAWYTRKMAAEMEKQRLEEAQPYLLLKLKERLLEGWNDPAESKIPINMDGFLVKILNAGKAPAINLKAAFWYKERHPFAFDTLVYLVSKDEWEAKIRSWPAMGEVSEEHLWLPQLIKVIQHPEKGVIAVEYQDIHRKRTWVSYLCLERTANDRTCAVESEEHNIVEVNQND